MNLEESFYSILIYFDCNMNHFMGGQEILSSLSQRPTAVNLTFNGSRYVIFSISFIFFVAIEIFGVFFWFHNAMNGYSMDSNIDEIGRR